jgi:hypothetical protein
MATINEVVGQARTLINAALTPEFTLLDEDWNPGDPTLKLRDPQKLARGSLLCVGLTTFAVLDPGTESTIVVGIDGSPADEVLPKNSFVLVRPRHTTWQIFSEVRATVEELSSARHGLYGAVEETFTVDPAWGTYVLSGTPLKILRVRYRVHGSTDDWNDTRWYYHPGAPNGPTIEAPVAPAGTELHIQYAVQYEAPTSLDDTLESLGMPDRLTRLLAVGAARDLALSNESRRGQPFSQGDPRRADEVSMGNNAMVFDRLSRMFRDLVADERARLLQQHPYRHQMEQFR